MKKLNKKIQEAIREDWPMYWQYGWKDGYHLRAVTGFHENGVRIKRMLYKTEDPAHAKQVELLIQEIRKSPEYDPRSLKDVFVSQGLAWNCVEPRDPQCRM